MYFIDTATILFHNFDQIFIFLKGLVFLHEKDTSPKHVQYKIRMGKDSVPSTEMLKNK